MNRVRTLSLMALAVITMIVVSSAAIGWVRPGELLALAGAFFFGLAIGGRRR